MKTEQRPCATNRVSDSEVLPLARRVASAIPADKRPDGVTYADAIQDASLLVLYHRDRHTPALAARIPYDPWIYARTLLDLRKQYQRETVKQSAVRLAVTEAYRETSCDPTDRTVDARIDVEEALTLLTPVQRSVVEAVCIRGETQASIARLRGTGQPAVSQVLQRGLQRMITALRR